MLPVVRVPKTVNTENPALRSLFSVSLVGFGTGVGAVVYLGRR